MMALVDAWLRLGCEKAHTKTLKRKVLNVNVASIATLILMVMIHVTYLAVGNAGLTKATWALIPFYPITILVHLLNHRGYHQAARMTLCLDVTAVVAFNIFYVSGSWLGLHYYFVAVIIAAPVLFPLQQWPIPTLIAIINGLLFIYCEYEIVSPDASLLTLSVSLSSYLRLGHISSALLASLIVSAIGDLMASDNEKELESLSNVDTLTGLPNRRRLIQRLHESIATSKRTGQHGAVIFLDLDNFKALNDLHGHDAGDLLLQEVARRMSQCLREIDVVARFGGDEFVVLLTLLSKNADQAQRHAHQVAEKIRATLAEPYRLQICLTDAHGALVEHRCTASMGVTLFQGSAVPEDMILTQADEAMYRAKEGGRNAICFHGEPS